MDNDCDGPAVGRGGGADMAVKRLVCVRVLGRVVSVWLPCRRKR